MTQTPEHHCHSCELCSFGILGGASAEVLRIWNAAKSVVDYGRGHIIFHEGEPSRGIYCVFSGRLKLYRTGPSGDLQIVRLAGRSQVLGHRSLFAGENLSATAEVLQDASLCFVEARVVQECIHKDPLVAHNLLRVLAKELGQAEAHLLTVARLSTNARLATLLLELADGKEGPIAELTREELGQIIGVAPESVSRSLHALARVGAISLDKRKITVTHRALLGELANDPS